MKITFKNIEHIYKLLTTTDWINSEITLEKAEISIDEAKLLLANIHLLHDKEYKEESKEQLRELLKDNFDKLNSYEIYDKINDRKAKLKNESLPLENINKSLYAEILPYSTLLSKMFDIDEVVIASKLATYFSDINEAKKYLENINYANSETILLSFQNSEKLDFSKPNIAISYNYEVGGFTSPEVKNRIIEQNGNISSIDYRKIIPLYTEEQYLEKTLTFGKAQAKKFLENVDGLIIPGNGRAVYPELFNSDSEEDFGETDKERSIAESILLDVALQKGIPIMGACGGHQLINVYFGGELTNKGFLDYKNVIIDKNSELVRIIDDSSPQKFWAAHKQIVNKIGDSGFLKPIAWVNGDRIVATESKFGAPIKTFQFHPEMKCDQNENELNRNNKIFKAFVKTCNSYKLKKINLKNITSNTSKIIIEPEAYPPENKIPITKLQNFSNIIKEVISKNSRHKYSTFEEIELNSKLLHQIIISKEINRDLYKNEIELINLGITFGQFLTLIKIDLVQQEFLLGNSNKIKTLIEVGISIGKLFAMEFDQQELFITYNYIIKKLINLGVSVEKLFAMEFDQQKFFIKYNSSIVKILDKTAISMEQFITMNFEQQKYFVENGDRIVEMLTENTISKEQFIAMSFDQQKFFVENGDRIVEMLIENTISKEQFIAMSFDQQKFFVEKYWDIKDLIKNTISREQFVAMSFDQQKFFVEKYWDIKDLIKNTISKEQFVAMSFDQQKFFVENDYRIKTLIDLGVSKKFVAMSFDQQKFFVENRDNIAGMLIKNTISKEQFVAMEFEQQKYFVENRGSIEKMLTKNTISKEQFIAMSFDQQKFFVEKYWDIKDLIKNSISKEQFVAMSFDQQKYFVENRDNIAGMLIKNSISKEQFVAMSFDQQKFFIETDYKIEIYGLTRHGLFKEQLFAMEFEQQKFFIEKIWTIDNLIEDGISMKQFVAMSFEQQKYLIENPDQVGYLAETDFSTLQLEELTVDMTGVTYEITMPAA